MSDRHPTFDMARASDTGVVLDTHLNGDARVGAELDGQIPSEDDASGLPLTRGPTHHFVAVHCDPGTGAQPELQFENLRQMIAVADALNMKLTLMLTPPWVTYIRSDSAREAEVLQWAQRGHELAGHHHSIYHPGTWDGYSDFTEVERRAVLGTRADLVEHLGPLDDLQEIIRSLVPNFVSGCANGERDKRVVPTGFRYDTCPGFYTTDAYPLGTRLMGSDSLAGQNDFILIGRIDGREHKFLNHGLISRAFQAQSQAAFRAADGGVFGVVVHTKSADVVALTTWLNFVSESGTTLPVTVREAIESTDLPERELDEALFLRVWPADPPRPRESP